MYNVGLIKFKKFMDENGQLTPIEENRDTPFTIKRIYYITNVPEGARRGFHSHRHLHQILICLNGSVKIQVHNGEIKEDYELNEPSMGLYIGPKVWREMYDFSAGSVLMVLASEYYDESDYIRSYSDYLLDTKNFFER